MAKTREENLTTTKTESFEIDRVIPPCTELSYVVTSTHSKSRIPFKGWGLIDATIIIKGAKAAGMGIKVKEFRLKASEFFTPEELRSHISGQIDNVNDHSVEIVQKSSKIC